MFFAFKKITALQHPLIFATAAFIVGILSFVWYNDYYGIILFLFSISAVTVFLYMLRVLSLYIIIILLTFFIIGYYRTYFYYTEYESLSQSIMDKKVTVQGSITHIDHIDHAYFNSCITFSIHNILEQNNAWKPLNKTIQIYTKKSKRFAVDDILVFKELLLNSPQKESFKFYLMKEGIDATCFIPTLHYQLLKKPYHSFDRFLNSHKMRIGTDCAHKFSPYTYALFSSLFLGCKKQCKEELSHINEQFKQWGILHYLARSGLHLVIFVFVWQTILRAIPASLFIKNLIMVLLGIFYFILTWPSISFIRAFFIFLFYKICSFVNVQSSLFHLLALCCLCILPYNPFQLFALDFQLSFILTFALAWFSLAYPKY